jgi:hypothetical protein
MYNSALLFACRVTILDVQYDATSVVGVAPIHPGLTLWFKHKTNLDLGHNTGKRWIIFAVYVCWHH